MKNNNYSNIPGNDLDLDQFVHNVINISLDNDEQCKMVISAVQFLEQKGDNALAIQNDSMDPDAEAMEFYEAARNICAEINEPFLSEIEEQLDHKLADLHFENENYDEAGKIYDELIECCYHDNGYSQDENKLKPLIQKKVDITWAQVQESYLGNDGKEVYEVIDSLAEKGLYFQEGGYFIKARLFLQHAMDISEGNHPGYYAAPCYKAIAECYQKDNNHKQAVINYNQALFYSLEIYEEDYHENEIIDRTQNINKLIESIISIYQNHENDISDANLKHSIIKNIQRSATIHEYEDTYNADQEQAQKYITKIDAPVAMNLEADGVVDNITPFAAINQLTPQIMSPDLQNLLNNQTQQLMAEDLQMGGELSNDDSSDL